MQNILGAVLCGGQSKRMGTDKGLIAFEGTIRAKYVAQKLSSFNIPVVFSVNELQVTEYAIHIPADQLIVDSVDVEGPLKGLLSIHASFPENNLLLLACDMLDLDQHTIQQIIKVYETEPGYDFYVYQDEKYAQPFCGIYTAKSLRSLLLKAGEHIVTQFSMQHMLDEGNTKRIPIEDHKAFRNYNIQTN
jgi:molybdopterin-guanine dinucleotide biosynthesis protein A